jgi:hypothetical protein
VACCAVLARGTGKKQLILTPCETIGIAREVMTHAVEDAKATGVELREVTLLFTSHFNPADPPRA